jgi:hypothetical protein
MLGITQVALGAILLVRLYILDQPDSEVRDLQLILFGSIVGYFVLRSFLGGFMPVPTPRQAAIAYGGMVAFLFVVLSLWLGLPDLNDWTNNILPVLVGPAIIVGGYWTIAALGKRRIERMLAG